MRQWQYYIVEADGRSLMVHNGVVVSTINRSRLNYSPDGWQGLSIGWERNMSDFGVVRIVSVPLMFLLDGALILRNERYTKNIERELYLVITKHKLNLTPTEYQHFYQFFYKGRFDFTTFEDDGTKVSIQLGESGLHRKFNANRGIVYEIKINECDYDSVKMDGIDLQMKQNFLVAQAFQSNSLDNGIHLVGLFPTSAEGSASGFIPFSSYFDKNEPSDYTSDFRYHFLTTQVIQNIRIKGKVSVKVAVDGANYKLELKTSQGRTFEMVNSPVTNNDNYFTFPVDFTLDSLEDEKFFFIGTYNVGIGNIILYEESEISIEFISRRPSSIAKGLRPSVVAKKLCEKMFGSADYCDTTYLEQFDHLILSPGDAIRGIDGVVMKVSWDQFADFCRVQMAAGHGIEQNKLSVNSFDHYFTTANPIEIPRVKNLKVSTAKDLLFNTIKAGYQEPKVDDVNGKSSFNCTHLYSTPILSVKKEYNLICPFSADPYLIENYRINLEGKTTTDNSSDNEIFILDTVSEAIQYFSVATFGASLQVLYLEGLAPYISNFLPGSRFTIAGTAFNNKTFTVFDSTIAGANDLAVSVTETVVDEGPIQSFLSLKSTTLRRENYTSITGVPTSSVFNVELSPKRILLKHVKYINSIMDGFAGKALKFESTERNRELKTVLNGITIDEDADVEIGNEKLFLPYDFDLDTEEPADLVESLNTDPNRPFSFGNGCMGFLRKVAIQPDTREEQAYKLLAAPDSNLLKIHINAYK